MKEHLDPRWRDQSGLVGKILAVWLIVVVLLGLVAVDAASIAMTTYRLSSRAAEAATTGAAVLRQSRDREAACEKARAVIETSDPGQTIGRSFCRIDVQSETVTITLKATASTILAGRVSFTEDLTRIVIKESGRPSGV
jgi:hypothetical protein